MTPRSRRSPLTLVAAAVLARLAWLTLRPRAGLRGATVLVTGGSRGLGLLLARELADRGARVVLCARDAAELERAREELAARGAQVLTVACDVADRAAVEEMVARAERELGPIEVLVNNASIIQVAPAEALSLEDYRAAMDANFWGMVHATLAVLPRLRERRGGRIVNITSIGGTVAVPHLLGYTSAKFAAVGFSTGLAAEVAKDGVAVTTVVPGLMRTGSSLHALVKGQRRREANLFSLVSSLPLVTMDAGRAARRIVLALERRERFVTLGLPARLLRLAAALAPNAMGATFALVARLLPGARGEDPRSTAAPGGLYRTGLGGLTALGDRAARRNNEEPAPL
jgi:short-subunit dehydrogenase